MSNKKQSSVQLFAIALYEKGFLKGNGNDINDLLEEHKAMHKEEVQDAYRISPNNELWSNSGIDYYNETFGGNNENKNS